MLKRTLPVSLLVLGALAVPFFMMRADEIEDRFHQFDLNHDGKITGDEFHGESYLSRLDLNKDGVLTLDETKTAIGLWKRSQQGQREGAGQGKRLERLFEKLDKNGDGKLDSAEVPEDAWRDRLDANQDGFITLDEAQKKVDLIFQNGNEPASTPPAPPAELDKALTEGPQVLKPGDHGIGRLVADIALTDLSGKQMSLSTMKDSKALVLAFFSATCPVSNKLGPELARMEKEYQEKGVALLLVDPVPLDTEEEIRAFTQKFGLGSTVVHDKTLALATALQATVTTEVFVLDQARTLVYRGAVNDQYGLGYQLEAPRQKFLQAALASILKGEAPLVAATTAPGCALDLPRAATASAPDKFTYHRNVSRILQNHCVECHRPDGLAPFSLETYADVIKHAGMIKKQVARGAMPPWFAAGPESGHESPWGNDRSLPEQDKAGLLAWLDSDRAMGETADAPLPRTFPQGWVIGAPDAVFQLPQAVDIKAEGTMAYQNISVPTQFPEDRWVQAYEIVPTDRGVVHHVIVKVVAKGGRLGPDEDRIEREGYFAAYVPGNSFRTLPQGFAKKLPAGATLHFQIHYTPNGKATKDQLRIGFKFAPEPPQYVVHVAAVSQPRLNIPAGAANHIETAQQKTPADLMVTGFMAHMHVRGKSFKYEVTYPDGRKETLLDIPRYDFNWQLAYNLAKPRLIPRGSTVKVTAGYDNSASNPANPDPTRNVRWGQQTYDEMMIGYVEHYAPYVSPKVAGR